MASERQRLLELALESLRNKKKQIDDEIETLTRQLRGGRVSKAPALTRKFAPTSKRKRPRFTEEERLRRSERMKAYWENYRKNKGQK